MFWDLLCQPSGGTYSYSTLFLFSFTGDIRYFKANSDTSASKGLDLLFVSSALLFMALFY
jgi:hypothetical protein